MATWNLPLEINNLTARVNAAGGGSGGVTNPLTSNLAAAGFSLTGASTVAATALTAATINSVSVNTGASGYYSLVVGGAASAPSGDRNTIIGFNTAAGALAGLSNTLVGSGVAPGITGSASNNTAVGQAAAYGLTTGGGNTLVGNGAGGLLTTGVGNICIGASASTSLAASAYETVLGVGSTGFGAYTVTLGSSIPLTPFSGAPVCNNITATYRTGYCLNRMETGVTYQCLVTSAANNISVAFSTYGIYELIVATTSTAAVYGIWMCNNGGGAAFTPLNTPVGVTAASLASGMILSGFPNGVTFFLTLTRKSFWDA